MVRRSCRGRRTRGSNPALTFRVISVKYLDRCYASEVVVVVVAVVVVVVVVVVLAAAVAVVVLPS